jgi:hypothetical protein
MLKPLADVSEVLTVSNVIQEINASESSVSFYQATQRIAPEHSLHTRRGEELTFQHLSICFVLGGGGRHLRSL